MFFNRHDSRVWAYLFLFALAGCAHDEKRIAEANFYTKLGISNLISQNCTEALRYLLEADKRQSDNPDLQNALGLSYYCKGEYPLAVESYKKAIKLRDNFSEAYNNLGAAYAAEGQYDNAIAAFNQAISNLLYETPERAWLNKGDAYAARLDSKDAIMSYERALALAMPKPQARDVACMAYTKLGAVYNSDKHYYDAIRAGNSAIKLCPKFADPYVQLFNAYSRLGNKDAAYRSCEKVQVLAPDSRDAQYCARFNDLIRGKAR